MSSMFSPQKSLSRLPATIPDSNTLTASGSYTTASAKTSSGSSLEW